MQNQSAVLCIERFDIHKIPLICSQTANMVTICGEYKGSTCRSDVAGIVFENGQERKRSHYFVSLFSVLIDCFAHNSVTRHPILTGVGIKM